MTVASQAAFIGTISHVAVISGSLSHGFFHVQVLDIEDAMQQHHAVAPSGDKDYVNESIPISELVHLRSGVRSHC